MSIPLLSLKALIGLGLSGFMAFRGLKKKNLSEDGAAAAVLMSTPLFTFNPAMGLLLICFYLAGSRLTHWRSDVKNKQEETSTSRNWYQVYCNSIILLLSSLTYYSFPQLRYTSSLIAIASVSCASGDTWASEIGSAIGKSPINILTWKPSKPGCNGGITLEGTLASLAGGLYIGSVYYGLSLLFQEDLFAFSLAKCLLLGGISGFLGSMIDSVLGSTVQPTYFDRLKGLIVPKAGGQNTKQIGGWIGMSFLSNEGVNLWSALATSLILISVFPQ